ncbi:MAG: endo-1,4-beta-xylanase [Comamonadaceae bacterium]|nr:MAG: endo-1,4-beta-xylanase [Comamonadaceae bacterium]
MDESTEFQRKPIDNADEQLLRPIIQPWVVDGIVTYTAFYLSTADKKDMNRLSVSRGSAVTAQRAYEIRAQHLQDRCAANGKTYVPPVGVLAVSAGDVDSVELTEQHGGTRPLSAWDDSMNDHVPDDHGHIDYSEVAADKGQHVFVAKELTTRARTAGWKHPAPDSPPGP